MTDPRNSVEFLLGEIHADSRHTRQRVDEIFTRIEDHETRLGRLETRHRVSVRSRRGVLGFIGAIGGAIGWLLGK